MFTKQSGGSSQRHDSRKFPGNRRGRRRRRRGASSTVLSEPISLDNFSHFLAFERSLPFHRPIIIVRRFPTIPNFFLPLVRHSRSLCARNGGRVVGFEIRALESGVCRAVTRDLSRSTEVEAGLCLISSDPLIPSKSMFATKRPSSGIFYLMLLVSLHERRS